ncbi:DNA ligase 1 [Linum grandiflorum]
MSNHPLNAFDVLKSNAKAAYEKKRPAQSSPSKKRKSPEAPSPIEEAKQPESEIQSPTEQPAAASEASKKRRMEGKVEELKGKVGALKKKPKDFDPMKVACWEKGEKIPFIFFSLALEVIEKENSRIVITDVACNMLRTVMETTPDDLLPVVYLLAQRIAPAHEGIELGIGESILIKALAEAYSTTERDVKRSYQKEGDLGDVAAASRGTQRTMSQPEQLTVSKVFDTFRLISKQSGKDSRDSKRKHIKGLLVAAIDCEPKYIMRLLQSKLRIGFSEQTLLAALGQASVYIEKHSKPPSHVKSPVEEAAQIVKEAYSVLPVYDIIVPALLNDGVWNLSETCNLLAPGVPVAPMLAKSAKAVSEIVDKFQDIEFTCEYKYDGERAQIHYTEDGKVEIYSRNAGRNTGKFPDVVATISRLKKSPVQSFILDCELVAYDRGNNKILPFQILRKRAHKNVVVSEIKIDVCIFAFDILYLNGEPLIQEQLEVRRERLYGSFEVETGFFQYATALTSNDLGEIQNFLNAAVGSSTEGLIIKTLNKDATYEPSKRSQNWLKLKKDYMESLGDSFDLVPIGAFHGTGKRTGFYGAFLLACYDNNKEEYQTICKLGTGFSESELEKHYTRLRSKVITEPKSYYRFGEKLNPDVWFEPSEVWEVKAADLTISPVYCAAIGAVHRNKGISLRFPRMLRVRTDKAPKEASSAERVAEMYNAQKHTQPHPDAANDEDKECDSRFGMLT